MLQYQARDHARAGGAAVGAAANCKADVIQAPGAVGAAVLAVVLMLNAVLGEGWERGEDGGWFQPAISTVDMANAFDSTHWPVMFAAVQQSAPALLLTVYSGLMQRAKRHRLCRTCTTRPWPARSGRPPMWSVGRAGMTMQSTASGLSCNSPSVASTAATGSWPWSPPQLSSYGSNTSSTARKRHSSDAVWRLSGCCCPLSTSCRVE